MQQLRLTVEDDPDPRDVERLEDGLYEYNASRIGASDGRLLAVFLRDGEDRVVGGAEGNTWNGCLDLKRLWVDEALRGSGHGTRLLRAAEDQAKSRGCHTAILDTYEFQAPEFYKKLGYDVYGVIDDPQTGTKKIFLKRSLRTSERG